MHWLAAMGILIGSLLTLMALGVPVAYAFFAVNAAGLWYLGGTPALAELVRSGYSSLALFVLLPVTLFVLLGEVLFQTGLASKLLQAIDNWVGRLPGRLSVLTVATGAALGSLSGASIGSTAMLGTSMLPEMDARGYHNKMTLGPIVGAGGLSVVIPPSGLAIILAVIAQVSVGDLLISIIVPGVGLAVVYVIYIVGRCMASPDLAPAYDARTTPMRVKIESALLHIVPLSLIFFLVMGTIFMGIATPSESAALGCVGALILAGAHGQLNVVVVGRIVRQTTQIAGMVLLILAGAQAFSQVLALTGLSRGLSSWTLSLAVEPVLVVGAMLLVIVLLGMFISGVPLMLITVPIFMPIVLSFDMNPLWFSVLVLFCVELGQVTPPYGTQLFVLKAVAPSGVTYLDIVRSSFPFMLIQAAAIVCVLAFPGLALWLPNHSG